MAPVPAESQRPDGGCYALVMPLDETEGARAQASGDPSVVAIEDETGTRLCRVIETSTNAPQDEATQDIAGMVVVQLSENTFHALQEQLARFRLAVRNQVGRTGGDVDAVGSGSDDVAAASIQRGTAAFMKDLAAAQAPDRSEAAVETASDASRVLVRKLSLDEYAALSEAGATHIFEDNGEKFALVAAEEIPQYETVLVFRAVPDLMQKLATHIAGLLDTQDIPFLRGSEVHERRAKTLALQIGMQATLAAACYRLAEIDADPPIDVFGRPTPISPKTPPAVRVLGVNRELRRTGRFRRGPNGLYAETGAAAA